jgi:hypothetical protein
LVYRTDPQNILDACKWVRANAATLGVNSLPGSINGPGFGGKPAPGLPPALANLNFESINIDSDRVVVMFGGGFYHWGFEATDATRQWGQWQLVPGLWYWNEAREYPEDPAKSHLERSTKLFLIGLPILAAGVVLLRRSQRKPPLPVV